MALEERPHGFSGAIAGAAASALVGSSHQRVVRGAGPRLKNIHGYLEGMDAAKSTHGTCGVTGSVLDATM